MLDYVIRGGQVVTNTGAAALDIGIADGRIVTLHESGSAFPLDADRVIDASDRLVVPGGIDPHVHTNSPMPNAKQEEYSDGPDRVSIAAAYGGTTTMADFAHWKPGESLDQTFDRKAAEWKGSSLVDFALHGTFREQEIPFDVLDQVPDAVAEGHTTYKVWMTNTTPGRRWQKTDIGHIWGLMEKTAEARAMLCVHAEDDDLVMYAYKRLQHEGHTDLEYMSRAHSQLSELLSFQRVITLAGRMGAPIYLMHVSAAEGIDAIRAARASNQPVYGETLQSYSYFTEADYRRDRGAIFHTYPSLKSSTDRDAMWIGLEEGVLSTVATDEVCTDLDSKLSGTTIMDTTGGHVGVEVRMAVTYTEAVHKRHFSLQHYVDITSRNAARILGAYPQKGEIAVGCDADLVLLETGLERPIAAEDLHESNYSAWEGYVAAAWPTLTMVRGTVLMENGCLTNARPGGELLKRRLRDDVADGAAL